MSLRTSPQLDPSTPIRSPHPALTLGHIDTNDTRLPLTDFFNLDSTFKPIPTTPTPIYSNNDAVSIVSSLFNLDNGDPFDFNQSDSNTYDTSTSPTTNSTSPTTNSTSSTTTSTSTTASTPITINGIGTAIYKNGDKFIGTIIDGKREGIGAYIFPNGDKYIGTFIHGKLQGLANFVCSSGLRIQCEFDQGVLVSNVIQNAFNSAS